MGGGDKSNFVILQHVLVLMLLVIDISLNFFPPAPSHEEQRTHKQRVALTANTTTFCHKLSFVCLAAVYESILHQ